MGLDALFTDSELSGWGVTSLVLGITSAAVLLSLGGLRALSAFVTPSSRENEDDVTDLASLPSGSERLVGRLSKGTRVSLALLVALGTNRLLLPEVASLRPLPEEIVLTLQVSTIVAGAWVLLRLGAGVRQWLDEQFDVSMPDNLRSRRVRTQTAFIERIFDVIVVVVSVAVVLAQFESGRRLSNGLLASAGVASLVIGFAAQRTLANLLAGFQIAFTSPIRLDDAVVVEGEWGWIEEISLTYVVVRVWDRRRLILPITYFVEKPFQNWTRKSGQILGSVFLEVAHHTPFEALNAELNRLLDANPLWDKDARVLQVVEMKERCVQLRALMTAKSSPECWDLRCHVRRGLIEFLVREHPDCLPSTRLALITSESKPLTHEESGAHELTPGRLVDPAR